MRRSIVLNLPLQQGFPVINAAGAKCTIKFELAPIFFVEVLERDDEEANYQQFLQKLIKVFLSYNKTSFVLAA